MEKQQKMGYLGFLGIEGLVGLLTGNLMQVPIILFSLAFFRKEEEQLTRRFLNG